MKMFTRKWICMICVMVSFLLLVACEKQEDFDAAGYVDATLKASFYGEYEEYAKRIGESEDKAKEELEKNYMESLKKSIESSGMKATEEEIQEYFNVEMELRKKVKFQVKETVKDKEDNFTVEVTYSPMKGYQWIETTFQQKIIEAKANNKDESSYMGIFIQCEKDALESLEYGEEKIMKFHVTHSKVNNQRIYEINPQELIEFEGLITGVNGSSK